MVAPFKDDLDYLEPEEVARWIINLDQSNDSGRCVDITFKDAK
jgi:hypothetical protein